MRGTLVFYLTFFLTINLIFGQEVLFFEDFNTCELSDQWAVKIEGNQNAAWSVGIPTNTKAEGLSINGSCMLVIDDDLTGDKTDSFNIRFTSAYFDGRGYSDLDFKAQVHFRRDQQEYLRILIDNGEKEYLIREFKNRNYSGDKFSDFVDISADLSFIASDSMRIIIEYDDANAWGWWAGIDNISVTGVKNGEIVMGENFNDCALPQGWTTEILNGVDNWKFGVFNDGRTIDGSCFVYFNDDILGETAPLSKIRIYSPTFDASTFANYTLTYDLIYRTYEANEYLQLYVDNGKEWIPVKIYTSDFGGPEVDKSMVDSIDLSPFRGAQIRLIWEHNDGGWAWWVGFDNVKVTGKGSINDRCNKALPLIVDGICLDFENTNALNSDDLDSNSDEGTSGYLYYSWTASNAARFEINTKSTFNDQIEIFEGTCQQHTKIGAIDRDEYGFIGESIQIDAQLNKNYIIRVSGRKAEFGLEKGSGCIALRSNPIQITNPNSDQCLAAINIQSNIPCAASKNIFADFDGPLPTKNNRSRADIWYAYTPQTTSKFEFKSNADFADVLAVYKGDCSQLTEVESNFSGQSISIKDVEAGQKYYFQVSGYFSILEGNVCGEIVEKQTPSLTNDDCISAISVPINGQCVSSDNVGASYSGIRPTCDYKVEADVWFSFVGPSANNVFLRASVDFEHILSVYQGNCTDLASLYCSKNAHYCNGYISVGNLNAGETYYVQIGSKVTSSGIRNGAICLEILDEDPMWTPINFEVNQTCISRGAVLLSPVNLDLTQDISFDGMGIDQAVLGGQRYIIEAKDKDGCVQAKVVDAQTCNDFGCTIAATIQHTNASCFGMNDGTATFSIEGGLEPYQIQWSNGITGSTQNALTAGTYQVTISDGSACELVRQVVISQPSEIIPNPIYVSPLCYGEETGSIKLAVIGGASPYQYEWSNGSQAAMLDNVSGGNYIVTITDSNNCTSKKTFELSQPEQIVVTETIIDNICPDESVGEISIVVRGGVGAYDIKWFGHEGMDNINNLASGTYAVEVIDGNNCIVFDTFTVNGPERFSLVVDSLDLQIGPMHSGFIGVGFTGGTPPYTYVWFLNDVVIATSNTSLSLTLPGEYKLKVTDANECNFESNLWVATTVNSAQDYGINNHLIISPNPVKDILTVKFEQTGVAAFWEIKDMMGRHAMQNDGTISRDILTIDVANLSPGTYTFTCKKDSNTFISKFVKI